MSAARTFGNACRSRGGRQTVTVVAIAIGVVYLVAGLIGGQPWFGLFGLVLMTAIGLAFWIGGTRNETVEALSTSGDERVNALNGQASMMAGNVVLLACLVMFVVRIAQGHDGSPYSWLAALGGVTYAIALVWRLRRG